ncbi:MAG: S16 family serine protease, partial [Bacilli bacterium]
IHDVFQNGLPADFRLVGATTVQPENIPEAIRSRCVEIFFKELNRSDLLEMIENGARRSGIALQEGVSEMFAAYSGNGRQAMNLLQTAVGLASMDGKRMITLADCQTVTRMSRMNPRFQHATLDESYVGRVNGLGVTGPTTGAVLEIEVVATPSEVDHFVVNGIVEEERLGSNSKQIVRKSMVRGAIENAWAVLKNTGWVSGSYHVVVNVPGGVPMDGPSAGVSLAIALYSAVHGTPINNRYAFTGEVSLHGDVKPVGGVQTKIEAAQNAGVTKVFVPKANAHDIPAQLSTEVISVRYLHEVFYEVFPNFTWIHREQSKEDDQKYPYNG